MWIIRRLAYRELTRKIPMRFRRILQKSIPQPAYEIREAAPPTAILTNRQLTSYRTAILRTVSGEDTDRDPYQRYAAVRKFVLLAVHGDHVTYDVETAGGGLIHALRLPAVSAEPAFRPIPKVPARSPAARRRGHLVE